MVFERVKKKDFGLIGRHKTMVFKEPMVVGGRKKVRFHDTDVFEFDPVGKRVTLNTGGFFTRTTKERINQASRQYGLGFSVVQRRKRFFVEQPSRKRSLLFFDRKISFRL